METVTLTCPRCGNAGTFIPENVGDVVARCGVCRWTQTKGDDDMGPEPMEPEPVEDFGPLLTEEEAAEMLGVKVQYLIDNTDIPHYRAGKRVGRRFYTWTTIARWLMTKDTNDDR